MLAAWSFMSWNHALSPLPPSCGRGFTAIASYRLSNNLAALYKLCAAPPLRTTHYALRTPYALLSLATGHWLLVTFLRPSY